MSKTVSGGTTEGIHFLIHHSKSIIYQNAEQEEKHNWQVWRRNDGAERNYVKTDAKHTWGLKPSEADGKQLEPKNCVSSKKKHIDARHDPVKYAYLDEMIIAERDFLFVRSTLVLTLYRLVISHIFNKRVRVKRCFMACKENVTQAHKW